jgi:chemotaxis protein MotB
MRSKQTIAIAVALAVACLPGIPGNAYSASKKLKKANTKYAKLETAHSLLLKEYADCRDSAIYYNATIRALSEKLMAQQIQIKEQKASNDQILNHLKDLSVISGSQAASINKFLESIGAKDAYIRDLQTAIARKDSITLALAMNLKSAIGSLDDKDINIKIDKGVIYVDISDKILFRTGKYEVSKSAREVLGKVARVLLAHPEIEFMVEGHTDYLPYREGLLLDNWDLSVKRATSVVRILQGEYGIPPARMTAAGRSEYVAIADNTTNEGRAGNRRTRIIILPLFDQFYKLLEKTK